MTAEPAAYLTVNEFTKWRHDLTGFFEIAVDRAANNLRMDMYEKFGEIVGKFKETDEDIEALFARVGVIEETVDRLEKKVDSLDQRIARLEQRVERIEQRVEKIEQRVERIEQKVDGLTSLVTLIAQALNVAIPDNLRQGNNS